MTALQRAQEIFNQMHHFQPASLRFKEASRLRAKESAIIAVELLMSEAEQKSLTFWADVLDHLKAM